MNFRRRITAFQMSPFGDVGLFYSELKDGRFFLPENLVMKDVGPGHGNIQAVPLLSFGGSRTPDGMGQELMDSLWQCGFRPTEGTGSAGSLAATQAHLKDMRTLVAKAQGVDFK